MFQTCITKGSPEQKQLAVNLIKQQVREIEQTEMSVQSDFERLFDHLINTADTDKDQKIDLK